MCTESFSLTEVSPPDRLFADPIHTSLTDYTVQDIYSTSYSIVRPLPSDRSVWNLWVGSTSSHGGMLICSSSPGKKPDCSHCEGSEFISECTPSLTAVSIWMFRFTKVWILARAQIEKRRERRLLKHTGPPHWTARLLQRGADCDTAQCQRVSLTCLTIASHFPRINSMIQKTRCPLLLAICTISVFKSRKG